jgi:hypothetical protein
MNKKMMNQFIYIILILFITSSAIPGCQCTSCSCGGRGSEKREITAWNIIPFEFILSRINKKEISRTAGGDNTGPAPSYQIESGGRLFITGAEVYYVRDGKIAWQSSPAKKYQKLNSRYYVATGDYVFCALADGRVIWKTGLVNSGSCEIRDGTLYVLTGHGEKKLNFKTGEGMM